MPHLSTLLHTARLADAFAPRAPFAGWRALAAPLAALLGLDTGLRPGTSPAEARQAEATDAALRLADAWRERAEASEARIQDLEDRLATFEETALDLRSRLVCAHGKLATRAATTRYRSLSVALERRHG